MSEQLDMIFGRIPVLECLRAAKRRPRRLYLLDTARGLEEVLKAAPGVPVEYLDRAGMDRLAPGGNHQGVILAAPPLPLWDLEDWLTRLDKTDAIAVLVDCVEDPHNLGAITRSASAFGAACVIFPKDRTAPLSPTAVKAAAGAMEHIGLVQVTNLARTVTRLQEAGFWVAALDAEGDKTIWEADLTGRIALVIGNEGDGVRRLVREKCDFRLSIPIRGPVTSLNASVSAGVVLAECCRQRRGLTL